jgi:hypothetical protein
MEEMFFVVLGMLIAAIVIFFVAIGIAAKERSATLFCIQCLGDVFSRTEKNETKAIKEAVWELHEFLFREGHKKTASLLASLIR